MTKELETTYERFCIMTESMSDEKAIMLLTLQHRRARNPFALAKEGITA